MGPSDLFLNLHRKAKLLPFRSRSHPGHIDSRRESEGTGVGVEGFSVQVTGEGQIFSGAIQEWCLLDSGPLLMVILWALRRQLYIVTHANSIPLLTMQACLQEA